MQIKRLIHLAIASEEFAEAKMMFLGCLSVLRTTTHLDLKTNK